jgi:serine/threonine protein kinase
LKEGSLKILLTTIKEVVLALSYLHHLGIVHGDLKCENVLLKSSTTEHGLVAKVADFGLARDLRGLDSYYASNISGDMKYLAPEVLEHNRVSPKMDTFSLGYLIYELASGQQTAMENVTLATHVQEVVHLRKRPSFPSTVLPALKALAEECWDHDPDKRPCDQLILRRLERMLAEYGSPSKQRSLKSFKDLTQTFGNMLASGVADDTVDGYLVPGLGSTMSPAESSRGGVTASIQNPLDPKFHISISMANQS